MLKSLLALFLVFAVSLILVQPRSVLAQAETSPDLRERGTGVPPVGVVSTDVKDVVPTDVNDVLSTNVKDVVHHGRDARATPELKDYFDYQLRSMKNRSLSSADLVRIEKDSQTPKPKSEFTNKQKIFLALFIVCLAGLVVVAIKHPCREKKPGDCDFIDNTY